MQDDVLNNNDLVVNDKPDCRRESAQGHEVKTLAQDLHRNKRDHHRHGDDEARHNRGTPIAKEQPYDQCSEQETYDDRIAHARNRFRYDTGLVVERTHLHTRRKTWTNGGHFLVNLISDLNSVAVRLAIDA